MGKDRLGKDRLGKVRLGIRRSAMGERNGQSVEGVRAYPARRERRTAWTKSFGGSPRISHDVVGPAEWVRSTVTR